MVSLTKDRKTEGITDAMRPWLLGIPAFLIVMLFLLWSLARLASWIVVVLRANK